MKLPSLKLNARGFSHHFIMMLVVLGTAVGGTAYLVASHAQVPYNNVFSCPSRPTLSVKTGSSNPTCTKYAQYVVGGIAVDGSFGPATQSAIRAFQYNNHVGNSGCTTAGPSSCDGIIGSATWNALVASNNKQTQATSYKAPTATPAPAHAAPTTAPKPPTAPPQPVTPVAPKPTTTDACAASVGSTYFYNGTTCVTLIKPTCAVNTTLVTVPGTNVTYYCKANATVTTAPPTTTAPAPAPTTTAACTSTVGSTYFYDGTRCVTLIKPTCAVNTTLVTVPGTNVTYYCKANATVTTTDPLVSCTYYVGVNETKTTNATHTKNFCDTIHKSELSWKNCPVVVSGQTTTAFHSVAYCAAHKPKTSTATAAPKPAEPAKPKPVVINKPSLCSTSQRATPSVNFGERSNCVAYLQYQIGGVTVDGKFEGPTKDKVAEYQRGHHLVDTSGKNVGPCTWEAIYTQKFDAGCQVTYSKTNLIVCTYNYNDTPRVVHVNTSSYTCKNQYNGTIGSAVPQADPVPVAKAAYPCTYFSGSLGSLTQPVPTKQACYNFRYTHSYGFCDLSKAVNVKNAGGVTFALYTHQHCDQIKESWGGVLADGRS
jgi:peptidoglycan hydrolase-like protein with peptidoglycan-binding domain